LRNSRTLSKAKFTSKNCWNAAPVTGQLICYNSINMEQPQKLQSNLENYNKILKATIEWNNNFIYLLIQNQLITNAKPLNMYRTIITSSKHFELEARWSGVVDLRCLLASLATKYKK
jgi:hypothetical protein